MDGWQIENAVRGEKLLYSRDGTFGVDGVEVVYFIECSTALKDKSSRKTDFSKVFVKVAGTRKEALSYNGKSTYHGLAMASKLAPCTEKMHRRLERVRREMAEFSNSFKELAQGRKRPQGEREDAPLVIIAPTPRYDLFMQKQLRKEAVAVAVGDEPKEKEKQNEESVKSATPKPRTVTLDDLVAEAVRGITSRGGEELDRQIYRVAQEVSQATGISFGYVLDNVRAVVLDLIEEENWWQRTREASKSADQRFYREGGIPSPVETGGERQANGDVDREGDPLRPRQGAGAVGQRGNG
jgi:hypothetical protein